MKCTRCIKVCFFIAMLFCISSKAQIANGGFELNISNPEHLGEWQLVHGWNNAGSATSTPDYYHIDSPVAADIPETPMAIVNAYEANAIMGLILCGKDQTNKREYISTQLANPLLINRHYRISFKICNGHKTETSPAGLSVSDIGILLSTSAPIQIGDTPILLEPQYKLETPLYNSEWSTISFVVQANEAYLHLTFGVFDSDSNIQIDLREGIDPLCAYYFVDDFKVESLPIDYDPMQHDFVDERLPVTKPKPQPNIELPEPFFLPNSFSPNGDHINETFQPIGNTLSEWEFSIFNIWGEQLFITEDENMSWDGNFEGKQCTNGNYVWKISYYVWDDVLMISKLVETEGIVILLR